MQSKHDNWVKYQMLMFCCLAGCHCQSKISFSLGPFFKDVHLYAVSLKSCVCMNRAEFPQGTLSFNSGSLSWSFRATDDLSLWGSWTLSGSVVPHGGCWGLGTSDWVICLGREGCRLSSVVHIQSRSYTKDKEALTWWSWPFQKSWADRKVWFLGASLGELLNYLACERCSMYKPFLWKRRDCKTCESWQSSRYVSPWSDKIPVGWRGRFACRGLPFPLRNVKQLWVLQVKLRIKESKGRGWGEQSITW